MRGPEQKSVHASPDGCQEAAACSVPLYAAVRDAGTVGAEAMACLCTSLARGVANESQSSKCPRGQLRASHISLPSLFPSWILPSSTSHF